MKSLESQRVKRNLWRDISITMEKIHVCNQKARGLHEGIETAE
jgi:hypothetical protein